MAKSSKPAGPAEAPLKATSKAAAPPAPASVPAAASKSSRSRGSSVPSEGNAVHAKATRTPSPTPVSPTATTKSISPTATKNIKTTTKDPLTTPKSPAAKSASAPPADTTAKAVVSKVKAPAATKPAKSGGKPEKAEDSPGKAKHDVGLKKPKTVPKVADPTEAYDELDAMTEKQFLAAQRVLLLAERATYLNQAQMLRAEADQLAEEMEPGDVQFDDESGEGTTVNVERERDLAMSAQAGLYVEDIDRALTRIEAKTYGICEGCHKPIVRARLQAMPFATQCVSCKNGGLSRR